MSVTNGLLYVVTKYAQLYLCDMETATCLCSVTLSSHIIFTTAVNTRTGGLMCVNTAGQVVFTTVCYHSLPPLDNIRVMVIDWRLRGNIIRTAPCWVV